MPLMLLNPSEARTDWHNDVSIALQELKGEPIDAYARQYVEAAPRAYQEYGDEGLRTQLFYIISNLRATTPNLKRLKKELQVLAKRIPNPGRLRPFEANPKGDDARFFKLYKASQLYRGMGGWLIVDLRSGPSGRVVFHGDKTDAEREYLKLTGLRANPRLLHREGENRLKDKAWVRGQLAREMHRLPKRMDHPPGIAYHMPEVSAAPEFDISHGRAEELMRRGNPGRDMSKMSDKDIINAADKVWQHLRRAFEGPFDWPTLMAVKPRLGGEFKELMDELDRRRQRKGNPAPDFRSHQAGTDPRGRDLSGMTAAELLIIYNKLWRRTRQRMGGMFDAPTLRVSLPQVYHEMKALDAAYRRALLREGAPPALASEQMPRQGNPYKDRKDNPTPRQGFETFHGAAPDRTRRVKVPQGWPTKLWMLGALKLLILSSGKRIRGGTVCAATGNRMFIVNANYTGRLGPGERATQIEYVTPSVSERAGPVWFHPFDNPPPVKEAGHGFLTLAGKGIRLTRRGIVG